MGQDKRRAVVGHSYGPSRRSQIIFFVAIAVILVVFIGGYALAIAAFDQPPDSYPDKSPWSTADAQQIPTRSPSTPCGEPGNAYPSAVDSPCAPETSANSASNNPPANNQSSGPNNSGEPAGQVNSGESTGQ
jgi:hypothetical protein